MAATPVAAGRPPHRVSVKSRGVVSLRLFPVVGGGSGGEVALGAGLLGVIVQGMDEFAHGDVGEVAAFAVGPFLVLLL